MKRDENKHEEELSGALSVEIECEVRDSLGKLISEHKQRCNSLVANLLRFLRRLWITTGVVTLSVTKNIAFSDTEPVDITNTAKAVFAGTDSAGGLPIAAPVMKMDGAAGILTSGIICGTGVTAATPTDYVIQTVIAHGTGSGQLSYNVTTIGSLSIVPPDTKVNIVRTFDNLSGASIDVKELALYVLANSASGVSSTIMIARDVLGAPVTVPNGSTLTVRYIFKVTT